jgi:endonuclease/exonuclease/phosphatase family metal-dependent hydrolase
MRTVRVRMFLTVAILFAFVTVARSQPPEIGGPRGIDVATLNLYVGADFAPVTNLDPSDPLFSVKLLNGVATIYGRIAASNFPKRADAMALEIVARAPDFVALQEVTLLRRQSPGDAIFGGTAPATRVELDFLATLLAAIQSHGGHYAVASQVQDADVELPLVTGPGLFDDIRFTDRDVILVRTDLPPGQLRTSNPQNANYDARVPLPIGSVLRGWCAVDVYLRGRSFRLINTHLELELPAGFPNIQAAQAAELLAGPANTPLPVVLAGDLNSDAYGKYGPVPYALLTGLGQFADAWSVARPHSLGLTWGHDEFLAVPGPFVFRLDVVLYRGSQFRAVDAEVIDPQIGLLPPLWFSDHGVLFTTIAIN